MTHLTVSRAMTYITPHTLNRTWRHPNNSKFVPNMDVPLVTILTPATLHSINMSK
jgi:hypothetical protein